MKLALLASALCSTIFAAGKWYVPDTPVKITFGVEVEHVRTATKSKRMYRSEYIKSEKYHREMQSISVNVAGSAEVAGTGGSASLGVDYVKENESKTIDERKNIKEDEVHYQPGKNQIERIVTIITRINGQSMTKIERRFVDIDATENRLDTHQMSIDYLNERFVDSGKPLKTVPFASFEMTAMGCRTRNEVLWRDRCYYEFGFSFRGSQLWGYDGAFYPTPEPYLNIFSKRSLFKSSYSERPSASILNPKYSGNIATGRALGTNVEIELWDYDTDSSPDLMCDTKILTSNLLNSLRKYGYYDKELKCYEDGRAEITFSVGY